MTFRRTSWIAECTHNSRFGESGAWVCELCDKLISCDHMSTRHSAALRATVCSYWRCAVVIMTDEEEEARLWEPSP